jgi:V/A-type H+-transporting ATPase subunit K
MDIGWIGVAACLGLSGLGSSIGLCTGGFAAIGAWKKCFIQNKAAPFTLVAFAATPLTQTIYGYILMNALNASSGNPMGKAMIGVFAGLAMGANAILQGRCAANACDAFGEINQGFGNYILVVGLIEPVALFVMVFFLGIVGTL